MFKKILIANRGEIACRVMRTARRLGVQTVAVYSDADANALHVRMADEAVHIGAAPAADSYLQQQRIIAAAQQTGAEAVHPGYGFLSENADFARACEQAGLVFIGPTPAAIDAMGSKSAAKRIMEAAGVPLVPGYHGDDQDAALLLREAARIGYPVLIKASAGGGGKGMRVVDSAADFPAALASAQREALAAFGDDKVLVEKYLLQPRHIEFQVFADSHGHALHLFERDCSVQRRHQKVLEEAPAPGLPAEQRLAMGRAAVAAAQAIQYRGAGTVEFIVAASGEFYFMEMNTRLQVEHPVTEAITGQDLVEWQLRVADGEVLPLSQDELSIQGHAIEARIYAEDPDKDFLPAIGRLLRWQFPEAAPGIRIDTGVVEGDQISLYYDPMIAKMIAWGADRAQALRRLHQALQATEIAGLTSNVKFLSQVVTHPAFVAGGVDTGFIAQHHQALLPVSACPAAVFAAAAIHQWLQAQAAAQQQALRRHDAGSPWQAVDGWRLAGAEPIGFEFIHQELPVAVALSPQADGFRIGIDGLEQFVQLVSQQAQCLELVVDQQRWRVTVVATPQLLYVLHQGVSYALRLPDPEAAALETTAGGGHLRAPMPGKVIAVLVEPGAQVVQGQALMILEAMKMEHTIAASADGVIADIHFAVGDLVADGQELLAIADAG